MDKHEFALVVKQAFATLGHDHPVAILCDAALHYNSTNAHNARAISAALDALSPYMDWTQREAA